MEEMKAHERFIAAAKGQPFDRLPLLEWAGWWDLTRKRWAKERPETEKWRYGNCIGIGDWT